MLSYDKLKAKNPTAAALLSACAYLSNGTSHGTYFEGKVLVGAQ